MAVKFKKVRQISLKEKIVLNFLLLSIGTIIIVATYSFYTSRNALLNRTFEQLTSVRTVKKNQMENFFTDRIRDIKLITVSEDVQRLFLMLKDHYSKPNSKYIDQLTVEEQQINIEYNRYLSRYLNSCGYYDNLMIVNTEGHLLNIKTTDKQQDNLIKYDSLKNYSLNELWQNILKTQKPIIQDFKLDKNSKQAMLYIGAPVFNNIHKLTGMVVLAISFEAINGIMYENNPHNGLGITGETYLVGNDFLMRTNSRFHKNSLLNTKVKTEASINAFNNKEETKILKDYRNIEVLSAYTNLNINNLNWVIIAEIDLSEAMIPVYNLRNNTILMSVLISVILFISALLISIKITSPLIKLKNAAIKIGQGNFNEHLEIKSNDEIGALTESFNIMMNQLEQQNIELEKERSLRLSSVIDGQEIERQRLSRELHDGLGQFLVAVRLRLESLMYSDQSKIINNIESIKLQFDNIIEEVKRMSYDLMPAVLDEFGLVNAIRNLCEEIESRNNITVKYTYNIEGDKLNRKVNTYIFRMVQEGMNNIVKHAKATNINIELLNKDCNINLLIEDNGIGFNIEERISTPNTNGIYNMRERANLLSGKLEITSKQGIGTRITAVIPINEI